MFVQWGGIYNMVVVGMCWWRLVLILIRHFRYANQPADHATSQLLFVIVKSCHFQVPALACELALSAGDLAIFADGAFTLHIFNIFSGLWQTALKLPQVSSCCCCLAVLQFHLRLSFQPKISFAGTVVGHYAMIAVRLSIR